MSINSVEVLGPPLSRVEYEARLAIGRADVFEPERLAAALADPPTTEAVNELTWQIETLCTDALASRFHGIGKRTLALAGQPPLRLSWNPAGTIGGFSPELSWDGAIARIGGLVDATFRDKAPGALLPRKYHAMEGLFIDRLTGQAMIRRSVWGAAGKYNRVARAPASAAELAQAGELLQAAQVNIPEVSSRPLPVYLEVGCGLDPSGLRGQRPATGKRIVELDKIAGSYANPLGEYQSALQAELPHFHQQASGDRKNIFFVIGDGGRLPFRTASIREIFMSNLINAPIDNDTRQAVLSESVRALEEEGSLVVRANWHTDEWPHDKMVQTLRSLGLGVSRSVEATDVEYGFLDEYYGKPSNVTAPAGYYVIANKYRL